MEREGGHTVSFSGEKIENKMPPNRSKYVRFSAIPLEESTTIQFPLRGLKTGVPISTPTQSERQSRLDYMLQNPMFTFCILVFLLLIVTGTIMLILYFVNDSKDEDLEGGSGSGSGSGVLE